VKHRPPNSGIQEEYLQPQERFEDELAIHLDRDQSWRKPPARTPSRTWHTRDSGTLGASHLRSPCQPHGDHAFIESLR